MSQGLPLSTYRLQLSREFGFDQAAALVPYLKALGISHLYASPFLKARAGSKHGYDIVDHAALNPEFGGNEAFIRLSDALRDAGLGLILDFVPNHMGIGYSDNAWWLDVLEWGRSSPHARAFDISWDHLPYRRGGGVLLPVLGQPYGEALHKGEIALKYDASAGTFSAWYFDHRFPIDPHRYSEMIKVIVAEAGAKDEPAGRALLEVATLYARRHAPTYADAPVYKQKLAAIEGAPTLIERGLAAYRADTEDGRQALHRLLERQHYRLAYWRLSVSGINYRRFFDINDLAGLRVEDPRVFRSVHALVARLIAEDRLQGLRLDHIDGLRDPMQYTRRLHQLIGNIRGRRKGDFHVTVEKILEQDEAMPRFPGVHGTTGYEWLNIISRVLLDDRDLPALDRTWRDFSGQQRPFAEILRKAKQRIIDTILSSEFTVLAEALARIAAGHYSTRDFGADRLRAALEAYAIEFPIYRTYITAAGASEADRLTVETAIAKARRGWPGPDPEIFDFLLGAITLDLLKDHRSYSRPRVRDFAFRLQQFTGPLMAKSLEDTAFYRYHRLIALNEVGNDPSTGAITVPDFQALMRERAQQSPFGMTTTATHDTKRGEDARMRILSLSELAGDWDAAVAEWRNFNQRVRQQPDTPSAAHEYMFYQALVGAWPSDGIDSTFVERMQAYAVKAAREGKQETSWVNVNETYEVSFTHFVRDALDREKSADFLRSFEAFANRAALLGALNSLSQLALKLMIPGIPDIYQGTEFWDLSLVDPDNRRPIDFDARKQFIREPEIDWSRLVQSWPDGRIKFALVHRLLALRQQQPDIFLRGRFRAVTIAGDHAEHVVAFARELGSTRIVVAVGRHFGSLTDSGRRLPVGWSGQITAEGNAFKDLLGSAASPSPAPELSQLFQTIPVAVLEAMP